MKIKIIAAIAILSSCLSLELSADEVTKQSLPVICPKLEIQTTEVNPNCRKIQFNIPADEARFKRLFQVWYIITDGMGELVFRVPIQIYDIDDVKIIKFDASPEMIKNGKLVLDCKRENPAASMLDVVTLDLSSLVGLNDQPAEQAGTGQPATRPGSKSKGSDKPQPDSEGRSR